MINVIHAGTARFAAIKRHLGLPADSSPVAYKRVEIRRATLIGPDDIVTRCQRSVAVLEELKTV